MYTLRYFLLTWMLISGTVLAAQNAVEDFDSLSRLPSRELMQSGRRYFEQHQPAKALSCFTIVGERYKQKRYANETELSIRALNNCACVYKFAYFDYTQAYEYLIRAYDLCESGQYETFLPVILVNLGDLLNDYSVSYGSEPLAQQASELFDQCIERAAESHNWELLTTAFFNLANQNYELDLQKYDIVFSKEIPDSTPDLAYVRLQYQAIEALQQGHYTEARQYFSEQLGVVTASWEPERDTLATYMGIAKTYELQQDYVQEAEYLDKALQLALANGIDDQAAGICKQLANSYQLMGNDEKQREYYLLYLQKKEDTHANQLANIAELNYLHELKKEEERATQMQEQQRRQQYLIIAIGIVLLVVLISALLLWRWNGQLRASNRRLFEKNKQLMRAEAEESKLRKSYNKQILQGERKESLLFRIQELLDDPATICQQDYTLAQLAKQVESNTTYVSQVINEKYGMTFSNVLGSFRVKEACRRMHDSQQYGNQTIEAFATSVGFKSRTAFINAFKRETGLTPSEYLRMASVGE
ncbi:MAG: helix-turn-helix domain-containing protein [Prevotella sp.]|nr:helix-turn-helix domain-containing protein [Prevotella sp.]